MFEMPQRLPPPRSPQTIQRARTAGAVRAAHPGAAAIRSDAPRCAGAAADVWWEFLTIKTQFPVSVRFFLAHGASGSKALAKSASRRRRGDCKFARRLRWRRLDGRLRPTAAASRALPRALGRNPSTEDGAIENLLVLLQARRVENMRPLPEPALLQPRLPAERLAAPQGDLRAARAAAAAADEPAGRGRLPARRDEGPRHEEHRRVSGRAAERGQYLLFDLCVAMLNV